MEMEVEIKREKKSEKRLFRDGVAVVHVARGSLLPFPLVLSCLGTCPLTKWNFSILSDGRTGIF